MPRPLATPVRLIAAFGDGRVSQFACLAAAVMTSFSRGSLRWRSRYCDRIGLHLRRDLVEEALLREGVLQPRGRTQRSGQKRRRHGMRQHALARDGAGAIVLAADAPGDVRRARRCCRCPSCCGSGALRARRDRRGAKPSQQSRGHVAGRVVARPVAERRRPRLVVPRDDVAAGIETGLLIDDERQAVVLAPRHFVLARQLHAHRLADGLREDRRVVGRPRRRRSVRSSRTLARRSRERSAAAGRAPSPSCCAADRRPASTTRSSRCVR